MKLEPKDIFESCLECLDPRTIRQRFIKTSSDLEGIIRKAHDDLSKVEEKIVEDKDAARYPFTAGLTKDKYEEILSKRLTVVPKHTWLCGRFQDRCVSVK